MPDTTVRVEYIGAVQNFSEVTITGNQQVWRIGSSAFVETDRASQLVASGKFSSLANDPAMLPANQAKVMATTSELGTELYAGGEVLALPGGVQVPSDWNAVAGVARILNKPTILDTEAVQDLVAAMFAGSHTNLTATYNDATGTLTLSAAGGGGTTAEEVQDFLNTSLAHANHSGVTVTYDDANNRFVIAAVGGSGESVLYRKINVTANAQTVTTIISGFGTSAALNAITVTPTVDGTSSLVLTLGNLGTFKLHSVAANVPAGANAGTGFTVVAPDPAGATTLADSALASMVIYNDPGATVASTLVTVAINAGNLSVQKTGLTAGTAYRFKVLF